MTDETLASAEGASAPSPDAQPPRPTRAWKDILEEIKDKSIGDDAEALEQVTKFRWQGRDFAMNAADPMTPAYLAFAAFHDAAEIRVYEALQELLPDQYPTRKLTLSKTSDTLVIEGMNVPRMIDMMVEEIHVKALGVTTADTELATVLAFLASKHQATSLPLIRKMLEDKEHREFEEGETPAGSNGASS